MSNFRVERVASTPGVDFAGALAQNVVLPARILLPESIGAGRNGMSLIRNICITSDDQLDWELWFWANQGQQQSGHPDQEGYLGLWSFSVASGDGKQYGAAGRYYYYIDGLGIPYHDADAHNAIAAGTFLNVSLINRSAAGKSASGWFRAIFGLEVTLGS